MKYRRKGVNMSCNVQCCSYMQSIKYSHMLCCIVLPNIMEIIHNFIILKIDLRDSVLMLSFFEYYRTQNIQYSIPKRIWLIIMECPYKRTKLTFESTVVEKDFFLY